MTSYYPQGEQHSTGSGLVGELAETTVDVMRAGSAWAGFQAYQNHREAGGELAESIWAGAVTARRWFTMGGVMCLWLVWSGICLWGWMMFHFGMKSVAPEYYAQTTGPGGYNEYVTSGAMTANLIIYGIVTVTVLGIQYCRIVTGGLHRRTWLFQAFRLPYMLTLWCPSFFLYLSLFVLPLTWGTVV